MLKFTLRSWVLFGLFVAFAERGFAVPELPPALSLPRTAALEDQLSYWAWVRD